MPEIFSSDRKRLKQILLNLLTNAIKFTFTGGEIIICITYNNPSIEISISDNGIGISEEKLEKLR